MAKIILEPNEVFEHFHSQESYTALLNGEAKYIDDNNTIQLVLNEIILTPAHKTHTLINTGAIECILECGHGVGGKTLR